MRTDMAVFLLAAMFVPPLIILALHGVYHLKKN